MLPTLCVIHWIRRCTAYSNGMSFGKLQKGEGVSCALVSVYPCRTLAQNGVKG